MGAALSRSGFHEFDCYDRDEILAFGRGRGQIASAIRGKRGQALLRLIRDALDAIPNKQLGSDSLRGDKGCYCAIGAAYWFSDKPLPYVDHPDYEDFEIDELIIDSASAHLNAAEILIQEIMWNNDECVRLKRGEIPAMLRRRRWLWMRAWVDNRIKEVPSVEGT